MPPLLPELVAQTQEQVRLLLDVTYFRVLGHLLQTEASASEVAQGADLTLKQAHHKLTRLLRAELIAVAQERKRGGRPVKIYRPVAAEYHLPFHLTDAGTFTEVIRETCRLPLDRHFGRVGETVMRHSNGSMVLQSGGKGQVLLTLAEQTLNATRWPELSFSGYFDHRLRPETAQELQKRLQELADWLAAQAVSDPQQGENYFLGLFLSPDGS